MNRQFKRITNLNLILIILFAATLLKASENNNYPIYSIEDTKYICLSVDHKTIFTLETVDDALTLKKRNVADGLLLQTFKTKLPETEIGGILISQDQQTVYMTGLHNDENERFPQLSAIYSIDLKSDKLDKIYEFKDKMSATRMFKTTNNYLILTPIDDSDWKYDLKTGKLSRMLGEKIYKSIFVASEKSGIVLAKYEKKEMQELYFCDLSKSMKMTKIGEYQPHTRFSTEEEDNMIPYMKIDNKDFDWVHESYNMNRYPSSIMELADNPKISEAIQQLDDFFEMPEYILADNTYLIAKQHSRDSDTRAIRVFNLVNPIRTKKSNMSATDLTELAKTVNAKYEMTKTAVISTILPQVFAAKFYKVDIAYINDGMTSTEHFTAIGAKGKFSVMREIEDLIPFVHKDFKINSDLSALLFEEAMDVLYPLGTFDVKHKAHYQKGNQWFFVRSESFGEKEGIVVDIDSDGKISKIEKKKKFGTK